MTNSTMINLPAQSAGLDLLTILKTSDLFSSLDEGTLQELIPELEHHSLLAGEVLMHQGDQDGRLYLLVSGSLTLIPPKSTGEGGQPQSITSPRRSIGEISLITGEACVNTVLAAEACSLVSLSKEGLSRIASRSPVAEAHILDCIQSSFHVAQLNQLLEESDTFGSLEQAALIDFQEEFSFKTLKGGQLLMQHGDPSEALYLVISGRLGVFMKDTDGSEKLLIELGRGQTVGEMGLITHETRSADVYALRDTLLARLSKESFDRLLNKHPKEIMEHFAGTSIRRLTGQIQGKLPPKKVAISIAILPARRDLPVKPFAARLAQALQALGSTMLINSQLCDEQLAREGIAQVSGEDPSNTRLMLWLSEQEAEHQYVIYESDPSLTGWTERCLRQADHILLLHGQDKPQALRLELPHWDRTPISLVMLYEDDPQRPGGTQSALAMYGLHDHFKVRLNRSSDYARLARLLTGNGIGLVLSGGGARSVAQIGVMRALTEAGFEIDAAGGASAGAMNAAMLAMDLSPVECLDRLVAAEKRPDYTFPIHSLTTGKNWTSSLKRLMADWQIEDLWLDFFCISANLTRSNLTIHRSGSLFQAIRASTSIPGILPPVYLDGDILVDGGLINNFPVNIMRSDPRIGYIIGIDVSDARDRSYPAYFGYSASGWQSLLAHFLPFIEKSKIPNILEILSESMMINKSQSEYSNRNLVDFYLSPPTSGYNLMDFDKIEAIAARGYDYGRKAVAEHQAG